jgi:hypothetical protein
VGVERLNGRNFAIGLGVVFAFLIAIVAFYALVAGAFANVNLVGALAAVSVAVAGIAWFKKTSSHK